MRLCDLDAYLTQVLPLSDGVFTGLYYRCPNDPRGKKAHAIEFAPPIIPAEYGADAPGWIALALAANAHYSAVPKWTRTGDTIETLTLTPSIAFPCCHINVTNGEVAP